MVPVDANLGGSDTESFGEHRLFIDVKEQGLTTRLRENQRWQDGDKISHRP